MEDELGQLLTGGLSLAFILAFLIFALWGQLTSLLLHWKIKKKTKDAFSWKFWWTNNWVRLVLGFTVPLLIAIFFTELKPLIGWVFEKFNMPYKLNTLLGFLTGIFMDVIIIGITKASKLKIFSK